MNTRFATATLFALVFSASTWAQRAPAIEAAHRAYYLGHYAQSLALYQRLAAQSNAEAAERAGFMLLQADALYGHQVQRDEVRAKALLLQAARAGRAGAGFILNMMDLAD